MSRNFGNLNLSNLAGGDNEKTKTDKYAALKILGIVIVVGLLIGGGWWLYHREEHLATRA